MGDKAAGTHTLIWNNYKLGMRGAEDEEFLKVPHVMWNSVNPSYRVLCLCGCFSEFKLKVTGFSHF